MLILPGILISSASVSLSWASRVWSVFMLHIGASCDYHAFFSGVGPQQEYATMSRDECPPTTPTACRIERAVTSFFSFPF